MNRLALPPANLRDELDAVEAVVAVDELEPVLAFLVSKKGGVNMGPGEQGVWLSYEGDEGACRLLMVAVVYVGDEGEVRSGDPIFKLVG